MVMTGGVSGWSAATGYACTNEAITRCSASEAATAMRRVLRLDNRFTIGKHRTGQHCDVRSALIKCEIPLSILRSLERTRRTCASTIANYSTGNSTRHHRSQKRSQEQGVGGGQNYESHALFYVGVPNVGDALAKAESLGGQRVMGPAKNPGGHLVVAHFRDPEGNLVGLAGPE